MSKQSFVIHDTKTSVEGSFHKKYSQRYEIDELTPGRLTVISLYFEGIY